MCNAAVYQMQILINNAPTDTMNMKNCSVFKYPKVHSEMHFKLLKTKKRKKKKALAHLLKVAETLLWNGPDLDKSRVNLSDLASLLWKLYQHLIWCKTQKNKLNRVCWNLWHSLFKCKWPVWPIRERVVIFEIWPCQCQIKRRN